MTTLGARPHRPRCDESGRRGEMASGLAADDRAGQREVVAAQHGLQVLQRLDPLASASATARDTAACRWQSHVREPQGPGTPAPAWKSPGDRKQPWHSGRR